MAFRGPDAHVEVVVTVQQADRPVDQLADDVRVTGVTLRFGRDVHQDLEQRDRRVSPPRHAADRVQRELADGRVRDVPSRSTAGDDVLAGLVGGGPELGVRLGVTGEHRCQARSRPSAASGSPPLR